MNGIQIKIDGENFQVDRPATMGGLLDLAGVTRQDHYLVRVENHSPGKAYRRLAQPVNVKNGDAFVTVFTGPATNA